MKNPSQKFHGKKSNERPSLKFGLAHVSLTMSGKPGHPKEFSLSFKLPKYFTTSNCLENKLSAERKMRQAA
jgi:hypothetical protein